MAFEHYRPGQRVAVIINRTTAEAAALPFTIASGIVGDPTNDGRLWVTLELMGDRGLPQMIDEQDIVGFTFRQPPGGVPQGQENARSAPRPPAADDNL